MVSAMWKTYTPEPKGQAKLPKVNFVGVLRSNYKRKEAKREEEKD
jgi:hypothetical protein